MTIKWLYCGVMLLWIALFILQGGGLDAYAQQRPLSESEWGSTKEPEINSDRSRVIASAAPPMAAPSGGTVKSSAAPINITQNMNESNLKDAENQKMLANAQRPTTLPTGNQGASNANPEKPKITGWLSDSEIFIAIACLIFGVIFLLATVFCTSRGYITGHVVIELMGFIFIITLAVFVLAVGYHQDQMAPVFGLLGSVAGYLFGHETKVNGPHPQNSAGETVEKK